MSLFSKVACLAGRHQPHRRGVEFDGRDFTGRCRHCGKDIERVGHKDWRLKTGS